jgi:hypothetical protein
VRAWGSRVANGFKLGRRTAIIRELVAEYRHAMRRFATVKTLDVWYARASVSEQAAARPEADARLDAAAQTLDELEERSSDAEASYRAGNAARRKALGNEVEKLRRRS